MKAVILAGGLGTRISEETANKPKPLVTIGGNPILWHIMKIYSHYNVNEFIICCGYMGYQIKEYFSNYFLHMSDVTIDLRSNSIDVHHQFSEPWKVTLVDTGINTMTGGRLKRIAEYLDDDQFCFTYGDGLANIDIQALVQDHLNSTRLATVTAIQPPERYGIIHVDEKAVIKITEKPINGGNWINGGFFVLSPKVLDFVDGDETVWEQGPLQALISMGQLNAYFHQGFWQSMDTLRERNYLEELWKTGEAPWRIW